MTANARLIPTDTGSFGVELSCPACGSEELTIDLLSEPYCFECSACGKKNLEIPDF